MLYLIFKLSLIFVLLSFSYLIFIFLLLFTVFVYIYILFIILTSDMTLSEFFNNLYFFFFIIFLYLHDYKWDTRYQLIAFYNIL